MYCIYAQYNKATQSNYRKFMINNLKIQNFKKDPDPKYMHNNNSRNDQ